MQLRAPSPLATTATLSLAQVRPLAAPGTCSHWAMSHHTLQSNSAPPAKRVGRRRERPTCIQCNVRRRCISGVSVTEEAEPLAAWVLACCGSPLRCRTALAVATAFRAPGRARGRLVVRRRIRAPCGGRDDFRRGRFCRRCQAERRSRHAPLSGPVGVAVPFISPRSLRRRRASGCGRRRAVMAGAAGAARCLLGAPALRRRWRNCWELLATAAPRCLGITRWMRGCCRRRIPRRPTSGARIRHSV